MAVAKKRAPAKRRSTGGVRGKARRAASRTRGFLGDVFTKKAVKGAAIGVGISQGSAILAPRVPQHGRMIRELGLYGGMIAAAKTGGLGGVVGFAIGNALAERYLPRLMNRGGMALQQQAAIQAPGSTFS